MSDAALLIIAGDDLSLDLAFDEDGVPVDLTGCTVFFTCKRDPNDADADALIAAQTSSHVDATAGKTRITVPRADLADLPAGNWYGDVQIRDAGGLLSTPSGVFTVKIVKGITTRAS